VIDERELISRAVGVQAPPQPSFERLLRRRDRKRRNQRIRAGVLGVAIAVVVGWLGINAIRSTPTVPADPPDEPPVDLGIFEPVAGRIVYYTDGSLWAVDPSAPSPSTLVRLDLGGTPEADDRFASFTVPLGWSSDGTQLLFMREDPTDETFPYDRHLFILHADGTESQVTSEPVGGAAISPDGSRVVFAADGGGLYVVDAAGGQQVQIADEGESPTFSAEGTQIAYLSESGQAGFEHVWVANADGTDAHEILTDETLAMGMSELTWSPAGDRIAMENQQEGHVAIYTFAPDGSDFTQVITGGFNHSWSPDGSQIAYGLPGRDGFSIADADGSNVQMFGFAAPGPWHPGTAENGAGG
jgi:dipeptidyl aminopeptidase/acylaminoacyl peptidase